MTLPKSNLTLACVATVFLIVACTAPTTEDLGASKKSSSTDTSDDTEATTAAPAATTATTATETGTTAAPPKTGDDTPTPAIGASAPAGSAACGEKTTLDACWTCCEDKVPSVAAASKKLSINWQKCACTSTTCATACKNDYCKSADPEADGTTSACIACLDDKTDGCDTADDTAWDALEADPSYAPAAACGAVAGCDAKPDPDDG